MFAKRLLQKAVPQQYIQHGHLTTSDLNIRITLHHGIPSTSSVLAYDPIQGLLAVGTLDGRIKVLGGDRIECLLISPIKLPFKSLEFFHNLGYLVSISNDNDIQIWSLEHRCVAFYMQWESNVTAFSVIQGSSFMYIGDEFGIVSVLKYDTEEEKLLRLPYNIPVASITGITAPISPTVVGILPQPSLPENRVLIAYENGLIILWDVSQDKYVFLRNSTDIQEKIEEGINSSDTVKSNVTSDPLGNGQEEKEICSLCWASTDGSILAVGYIDGDILLWNILSVSTRKAGAKAAPADVVKLQLSSAEKRLPVIVLHWRATGNVAHDHVGQLFVYGGDEIGSEEVLTVVNLEWPSGLDSLRCISRTDLKLHGSFADMIFLPVMGSYGKCNGAALFLLTNPGQLHTYDESSLSALASLEEGKSIYAVPFPRVIPLVDPLFAVSKLFLLPKGGKLTDAFAEVILTLRTAQASDQKTTRNWPLTGGFPSSLSLDGVLGVERVYIVGYQDGSVRVWDATFPSLALILEIRREIQGVKISGTTASVSALDLSCNTGSLAVGNECGLIKIYNLLGSSSDTDCLFVSETENEVIVNPGEGLQCAALISILKSPIRALQFSNSGDQLAVGCEDGQILMLNMHPFAVMFRKGGLGAVQASIVTMVMERSRPITGATENLVSKTVEEDVAQGMNCLFVADKNGHVFAIDATTGDMISSQPLHPKNQSCTVSMHVIVKETPAKKSSLEGIQADHGTSDSLVGTKSCPQQPDEIPCSPKSPTNSFLLLCCENALLLYSLSSAIEGDNRWLHKVDLQKPCCWSAMFRKDEQTMGLVLLYHTGLLEIRSIPDLELVGETSLLSVLRWNLSPSMAKTLSSDDHGHISLNNSSELAFISILSSENDFRIPDSLPCLHDKVVAAAAAAAAMSMASRVKIQDPSPGILSSIMKGFKSSLTVNTIRDSKGFSRSTFSEELEIMFSKNPFPDPSKSVAYEQEDVELSIDDIEIDDIVPLSSSSAAPSTSGLVHGRKKRDEENERDKLLGGSEVTIKPRMRTPEEIIAQYRKSGDVTGAAENARNKLAERQEKLERTALRSEELRAGAENFKSMADELVKTLERRKWWQI